MEEKEKKTYKKRDRPKKEECIYVRCTPEEKEKLAELAKEKNMTMSKFILFKCFGKQCYSVK